MYHLLRKLPAFQSDSFTKPKMWQKFTNEMSEMRKKVDTGRLNAGSKEEWTFAEQQLHMAITQKAEYGRSKPEARAKQVRCPFLCASIRHVPCCCPSH